MNNIFTGCLALALTLGLQSVCLADETVSQSTTKTEGPPVVLDSYMKPTVVQSKETTDAAGNVQKTVAPIIQERHERVMLPSSETTTTVTESAPVVKSEEKVVAKSTTCSVAKRRVAHHVRPRRRVCRTAMKRRPVAVAQKVILEKKVVQPAVMQRTDSTVSQSTVIERKDPALENE